MPWIRANTPTQGEKGQAKGAAFVKWLQEKGKGKGKGKAKGKGNAAKGACGKGGDAAMLAVEDIPRTPQAKTLRRSKPLKRLRSMRSKSFESLPSDEKEEVPNLPSGADGDGLPVKRLKKRKAAVKEEQAEEEENNEAGYARFALSFVSGCWQ